MVSNFKIRGIIVNFKIKVNNKYNSVTTNKIWISNAYF